MKTLLLACLLLLVPAPAAASQTDVDVIDALFKAAYEARQAGDADAYEAGKDELYAAMVDPTTKDACRPYIDLGLLVLDLIDFAERYPETGVLRFLGAGVAAAIDAKGHDCLLAI